MPITRQYKHMTDEVIVDLISLSPTEGKPNNGAVSSPPPEKIKCLLAMAITVFGTSFASSMIVLNNDRVPINQPPLPDIILDVSPSSPFAFQLAECIVFMLLIAMFSIIALHHHKLV